MPVATIVRSLAVAISSSRSGERARYLDQLLADLGAEVEMDGIRRERSVLEGLHTEFSFVGDAVPEEQGGPGGGSLIQDRVGGSVAVKRRVEARVHQPDGSQRPRLA